MGMDAKAYLWFGTNIAEDEFPESILEALPGSADDDGNHERIERWEENVLNPLGARLVSIGFDGDKYALAIVDFKYDWDFDSKRFDIPEMDEEDRAKLFEICKAVGWPCEDAAEIGWHLGATYA